MDPYIKYSVLKFADGGRGLKSAGRYKACVLLEDVAPPNVKVLLDVAPPFFA